MAEEDAVIVEANGSSSDQGHHKHPKPPANLNPGSEDPFGPPNDVIDTDETKPSNIPLFTNKNEVYSTQEEDSPLMQAVMKVPTIEPGKRQSIRKDGDPNSSVAVEELTASLHANDQPIYRVVTQPTVDKKTNKKSSISKPSKAGHQKKSSLKGKKIKQKFTICHMSLRVQLLQHLMPLLVDSIFYNFIGC